MNISEKDFILYITFIAKMREEIGDEKVDTILKDLKDKIALLGKMPITKAASKIVEDAFNSIKTERSGTMDYLLQKIESLEKEIEGLKVKKQYDPNKSKFLQRLDEVKKERCDHTFKRVGHQFNGHRECTKCGYMTNY